jgi:hypothetical protein
MRTLRKRLALGLSAALIGLTSTAAQAFCGFYAGKADAHLFNEASQVVLVRDGKRTVLSMQNDYQGPLSEFALVVPTPTTLQKGQVRVADKLIFERLDAYSAPRLAEYHDNDPCQVNFNWGMDARRMNSAERAYAGMPPPTYSPAMKSAARDQALGVTVEARYTLEEYDIVSLSATQSDGLETWLRENGYHIPQGASAALRPYINQGMKFFVAKVNLQEQRKTGYSTLRPLQFAFESEKFMLPMRLGMLNAPPDKAQDLIVYVLSKEGRVESSNYRTVKLPANMNLPHFVKPRFSDFYKALFDHEAAKEQHRVVFTEYFWDMAWCDPCAANPLSRDELRQAGVFWIDGEPDEAFKLMTAPTSASSPSNATRRIMVSGDARPAMLTRLHVRYTAQTFPEDLMFTQTKDRQNWQTRYVIQNPYDSSVAQCSAKVAQMDCEAMCQPRVEQVVSQNRDDPNSVYQTKPAKTLHRECLAACTSAKQSGIDAALRYYQTDLPRRLTAEKQTLAQLTGWGLSQIDAMPGARKFTEVSATPSPLPRPTPSIPIPWWERLFRSSGSASSPQ